MGALLLTIFLFPYSAIADIAHTRIRVTGLDSVERPSLHALEKDGLLYMAAEDFGDLFGASYYSSTQNQKIVMRLGVHPVTLTPMNPFVSVGDFLYQMAFPTIRDGNNLYVPVYHFLDIIGPFFPDSLVFDPRNREIEIFRSPYNITGIAVDEKANGTIVRIKTDVPFDSSHISHSIRREWLNVTVLGGTLDSVFIASQAMGGIVKQIVPYQFENAVQLSFLLDRKVLSRKVFVDPGEILISLQSSKNLDTDAINHQIQQSKKRWAIDKIIIDPGHGGRDPGATSPYSRLYEKDVNLEIAKRLKSLLVRNLDVEVLMTRESDKFIELKNRTKFANSHDGKLFISIHCNGNESRRVRGTSTYILGTARTDEALAVAEAENSVIELEESQEAYQEYQDAAHIINAIAQSAYLAESEELARLVTKKISDRTKVPNQGVHQGLFHVLMGAAMPRILVETAYISNAHEEKLLKTRNVQQKIAEAIYESIKEFKIKKESEIG